jgi:N-acetylmuramoyl-L-alanine amidase
MSSDANPNQIFRCFVVLAGLVLSHHAGAVSYDVIIDPGHGGKNLGASGAGTLEKHLTLKIAQALKSELKKSGISSMLTRTQDSYLTLAERVQFANMAKGKVFISIHCNSNMTQKSRGFEAFFLDVDGSREKEHVDAFKPANSNRIVGTIIAELKAQALQQQSAQLTAEVVKSMHQKLKAKNRGMKQANFNVLHGVHMPATIVEVGFINHRNEGKRLASTAYQNKIASALSSGIKKFLKKN